MFDRQDPVRHPLHREIAHTTEVEMPKP
jgi:hypothetical protein